MALRDKITALEEEGIFKYVRWYAHHNINTLDTVLKGWEQNKNTLFQLFGNELILSKDITFKLGTDELIDIIDETVHSYGSKAQTFIRAFYDLTSQGGTYQYNYDLQRLIYNDNLAANIFSGSDFSITLPNGQKLVINHGCKISKVLGKIAKELDLPGYEDFRILHSQALNQKTLKGNLCISIHPLDYMTMSDNNCGWCSCMSWADEGEYRRGTVEMMNSPMVVVAYLTAKEPYNIGDLEWSNKKWRELFIINKDIVTGVKPYPYHNEFIEKAVCDWLKELATTNLDWLYFDELVSYHHRQDFTFNGDEFKICFETDDMYNDFGTRSHIGYIGVQAPASIYHNYSGSAQCLLCGEYHGFETESDFICYECDDLARCIECGDRELRDRMYRLDDDWYCEYCYNNVAQDCALCNVTHHCNNTYDIHLMRKNNEGQYEILTSNNATVCSDCFYNLDHGESNSWIRKFFKEGYTFKTVRGNWTTYYVIDIDYCTEDGLELFQFDSMEDVQDYDGGIFIIKSFS